MQKKRRHIKVAWLGLDRAGKTTLIRRLITGEFSAADHRTMGMDVNEFELGEIKFVAWDIGGQKTFRDNLWSSYMAGSMGVVFVVDSADPPRFPEAKEELWKHVINNPMVEDIPILILANKQDLPTAVSPGAVARALDLHKVQGQSYSIMPTSAKTGFNVEAALDWLKQRILTKIKQL